MSPQLNYDGDVRDSFPEGEYAKNVAGETMADLFGYPLLVEGVEFDGVTTTVTVENVGRPAKGAE